MKVCIASDHRGYKLKQMLLEKLKEEYQIVDLGTNNETNTDYTKYAFLLGEKVSSKEYDFGILICGTGIGMSIACNKVKGIRCAKVDNVLDAEMTRRDNDANVIAISGNNDIEKATEIIRTFLTTKFTNMERYIKRIDDIRKYEIGDYSAR